MTYEQALSLSNDLRTRFDAPFSSHDKTQIEALYYEVLAKTFRPTSCQNCYHDALIEICLYLRNNKTMAKKCSYRLRAGFIINCPTFRSGKIFTNDNLTDEVAAEYLKQFPAMAEMFQAIPAGPSEQNNAQNALRGAENVGAYKVKQTRKNVVRSKIGKK